MTSPLHLRKTTLKEAFQQKYSIDEEEGEVQFVVQVPKSAPGRSGEGTLVVPRQLSLNNYNITHGGEEDELHEMCSRLCELDIADNALLEWTEVIKILSYSPKVTLLNISKNPLRKSTSTINEAVQDLDLSGFALEKLVLNSLYLQWTTIQQLLRLLPRLHELHLSLNEYSDIVSEEPEMFHNITTLHVSANNISDWKQVSKLGQTFPGLQTLIMTENQLESIDDTNAKEIFPHLECLNISKNALRDWIEVEKLRNFPVLNDLRMTSIPFMKDLNEKERRNRVVAYLPNITRLNGSKVGDTEREDAERAFIRLFLDSESKPNRYYELENVHGKLQPLVELDMAIKDDVEVLVVYKDKSRLMNINIKQTVAEMKKTQLAPWVHLPPSKFRIFYQYAGRSYGPDELRNPNKLLYSIRLRDGDEFHIVPKS